MINVLRLEKCNGTFGLAVIRQMVALTVAGDIDLFRQLRDVHVESVLHVVQSLRVCLIADERDGQSFGSESSGASNTMQVSVRVFRHVVVEDDVHTLNVHSTTEQVGGNQNTLVEVFELLVTRQTNRMTECQMGITKQYEKTNRSSCVIAR